MRNNAARMIENQIALEIRKLNSILTDEAEKPAIVQRIAELKKLVDSPPQPVVQEKSSTIADALIEAARAWRYR